MCKEQKQSRIPDFKSVQEEAEFWDAHSFTEFDDELEPAQLVPSPEYRRKVEEQRAGRQRRTVAG